MPLMRLLDSFSKFQSSPSPKAGSYLAKRLYVDLAAHVSILSQPEGRELPTLRLTLFTTARFQSSPSPKAGSYTITTKGVC